MSRIPNLKIEDAPTQIAEALSAVKAKLGMLPNLISVLAHSPAALHGYLRLSNATEHSFLDARQREIVALAVSQANSCAYCLAAHSLIGKGAGLSASDIRAARQGEGNNPHDLALARFARAVVQTRGQVTTDDYQQFLQAGYQVGDALDVLALVALNTLTNYTNHLAETVVDFPPVSLTLDEPS